MLPGAVLKQLAIAQTTSLHLLPLPLTASKRLEMELWAECRARGSGEVIAVSVCWLRVAQPAPGLTVAAGGHRQTPQQQGGQLSSCPCAATPPNQSPGMRKSWWWRMSGRKEGCHVEPRKSYIHSSLSPLLSSKPVPMPAPTEEVAIFLK
jgi:hypothetical protein